MPTPRPVLLAWLGLLALHLSTLVAGGAPADPADAPRRLDVSSDGLPDPVTVRDGAAGATRFRLVVPALTRRGGDGTLTVDARPLAFNDFGDGTPAGGAAPAAAPVTLHGGGDYEGGVLYEVRLPDPRTARRVWLFVAPEPADEHRLIVWPPGKGELKDPAKWPGWGDGDPERVLALRPAALPPDPLPVALGKAKLRLHGLVRNPDPVPGNGRREPDPQQVTVSGDPAGGGELDLDPNRLRLGPNGRVGWSTAVGRASVRVTFRPLGPDPLAQGRTAFELVPADAAGRKLFDLVSARPGGKRSYTVVYAASARGPHRLVVKEGAAVRQVVSLTDFERETRLRPVRDRLALPPGERAAVDKLAAVSGAKFSFSVHDRHVWAVTVAGDAARLDPALAELPRLVHLNHEPAVLPPAGLPSLARLPELQSVRIVGTVADDGLASLAAAPKLTSVQVFASAGLTARGVGHLARRPKVTLLQVGLPDPALDPPADDVLRALAAAPAVEQLQVFNVRPSDAGLAHLRPLGRLRSLSVSHADRLTPAGLKHLDALPALHHVELFRAALPADAVADFRARRPTVQFSTPAP